MGLKVQEVRLLLEVESGSEHGTTPSLDERLKYEKDEERRDVDFPES